jgi:mannose-6-phosphate isomerase-like protein (cupin superfamily)
MHNAMIVNFKDIEGNPPRTGGGGIWRRLIGADKTESGLVLGYGVVKPGDGRGWHSHPPGEDEIFYVIEGEGMAEWKIDGKLYQKKISSGSAFYTPGNMENNISNIGETDLLGVYCICNKSSK